MKKNLFVCYATCILSFVGCDDSTYSQESLDKISITAKNVNFSKMKSEDIGVFLKKCLENPIEMELIKFEKQNLKSYNIKNRDLEKLLLENCDTKDVYFYNEIFVVKPKTEITSKKNVWKYYGNSDENICSGQIFPEQNCETIDDTCQESYHFVYDTNVLGAFSGTNASSTNKLYHYAIQYNLWVGDSCGDSEIAVENSPTGAISRIN